MKDYHFLYKICVLGDSGVGKSSLCDRFVHEIFQEYHHSTIGVEFYPAYIPYDEDTVIKMQIWDTAGQLAFHNIIQSYFRGTDAFILVFDISSRASFNSLRLWIEKIHSFANQTDVPVLLIANKCDFDPQVPKDDIVSFVEEYSENVFLFLQTSAKDNTNVTELFQAVGRYIHEHYQERGIDKSRIRLIEPNRISLTDKVQNSWDECCTIL